MKKILILGGGFAGVETYRRLHQMLHPATRSEVQIELINRDNYFTFYPMLHEAATGSVSREHIVQPLREILSCCGDDFHQATVTKIDPEQQKVFTNEGEYDYDILVVALGVGQGWFNIPGADKFAIPLKRLTDAVAIRNRIIHSFENASEMHDENKVREMENNLHFIIVGGGASGVELSGQLSDLIKHEMKDFYGDVPTAITKITLVHAGDRILQQLSAGASKQAAKHLEKLGVEIMLNAMVTKVSADGVELKNGEFLAGNNIFWTAGTQSDLANILPKELLDERGLFITTPTMQVAGYPNIFTIGDCSTAADKNFEYPPLAQAAVQSAEVAASNITALLKNKPLSMRKYKHKGDIIPIGDWFGIFEWRRLRWSGSASWFIRRLVFLATMYGWANRLQVSFDWFISLFLPRDTSEL